ncbi:MAG: VWA domain-containing protein [Bryobacteraceae bacterium]|jgi:Ca-activated chloride channel homolog
MKTCRRLASHTIGLILLIPTFEFAGLAGPLPQQNSPLLSVTPLKNRNPAASANLKVDTTMVLVPVTVTDATDHPVTDLTPGAFRVFEDNVEQKVVSFQQEDGPVSVGFIFDSSSSMKKRMEPSIEAIKQFLKTLMPKDEFFLIRFADSPTVANGFTDNPDDILENLSFVQPQGWTALNDAIVLGIHKMRSAKNSRRALFVLTDGSDNNSRYTDNELRNLVRESDVRIYSIGLYERPQFLEKLGMDSGGKAYWAHNLDDLPATVERLSRDFRSQYVLGYAPHESHNDGKFRSVRVQILKTIEGMPLNVFWRHGYFSLPN